MTQTIDQATGEVIETTEERGVVVFNPTNVNLVHGMNVDISTMNFSEKLNLIRTVSNFIGGVASPADDFINMDLQVTGCMQHDVTVRDDEDRLLPAVRTVIMVKSANGKVYPEPQRVKFVSISAARFFGEFIIPMFGAGDWGGNEIPLRIRRIPIRSGVGSTFAFDVPGLNETKVKKGNHHSTTVTEQA